MTNKNKQYLIHESHAGLEFSTKGVTTSNLPHNVLCRCTGVFAVIKDTPNNNGRTYNKANYDKVLQPLVKKIQNGILLGEMEHTQRRTVHHPVSHRIVNIGWDEKRSAYVGTIDILNTSTGRDIYAVASTGSIFISSRALGGVNPKTGMVELTSIITFDVVATPGFSEAELRMVSESENSYAFENFILTDISDLDESIEDITRANNGDFYQSLEEEKQIINGELDVNETKLDDTNEPETNKIDESMNKDEILKLIVECFKTEDTRKIILESLTEGGFITQKTANQMIKESNEHNVTIQMFDGYVDGTLMPRVANMVSEANAESHSNIGKYLDESVLPEIDMKIQKSFDESINTIGNYNKDVFIPEINKTFSQLSAINENAGGEAIELIKIDEAFGKDDDKEVKKGDEDKSKDDDKEVKKGDEDKSKDDDKEVKKGDEDKSKDESKDGDDDKDGDDVDETKDGDDDKDGDDVDETKDGDDDKDGDDVDETKDGDDDKDGDDVDEAGAKKSRRKVGGKSQKVSPRAKKKDIIKRKLEEIKRLRADIKAGKTGGRKLVSEDGTERNLDNEEKALKEELQNIEKSSDDTNEGIDKQARIDELKAKDKLSDDEQKELKKLKAEVLIDESNSLIDNSVLFIDDVSKEINEGIQNYEYSEEPFYKFMPDSYKVIFESLTPEQKNVVRTCSLPHSKSIVDESSCYNFFSQLNINQIKQQYPSSDNELIAEGLDANGEKVDTTSKGIDFSTNEMQKPDIFAQLTKSMRNTRGF